MELDDYLSNAIANGELVEVYMEGGIGVDVIPSGELEAYINRGYKRYSQNPK